MNKWANNTIEEIQMANKTPAKCIHFNMQLINMQFSMQTEVCPTVIFKKTNERELEELGGTVFIAVGSADFHGSQYRD